VSFDKLNKALGKSLTQDLCNKAEAKAPDKFEKDKSEIEGQP
jgi:hypothetical protein